MKKSLVLSLAMFLLAGAAFAQQTKKAQLEQIFATLAADTLFNGNVLIAHKGAVVFQKSVGFADFDTKRPLNENTIFELASVSKQFTAMAILKLVDEGKLSLDDTLRKFFPELPYYGITVRHLVHHTSGLPDYMELMMEHWDMKKIANNDDMIAMLAKKRPKVGFAPGEKFEYSNTGYALLASIIKRASGVEYRSYMASALFTPLGMGSTTIHTRRYLPRNIPNYAYGYVMDRKSPVKRYVLPDSLQETNFVYALDGIVGDGTVNSTLDDLLKWDRALKAGKILKKKGLLQLAFTPGVLNNGDSTDYGFGWMIDRDSTLGICHSHSGGWPGYATYIARYPETHWTVIILRNAPSPGGLSVVLGEIDRVLHEKQPLFTMATMKMLDADTARYNGSYQIDSVISITFFHNNGRYYAQATGQRAGEVRPVAQNVFIAPREGAEFEFIAEPNQLPSALVLRQGGKTYHAKKLK